MEEWKTEFLPREGEMEKKALVHPETGWILTDINALRLNARPFLGRRSMATPPTFPPSPFPYYTCPPQPFHPYYAPPPRRRTLPHPQTYAGYFDRNRDFDGTSIDHPPIFEDMPRKRTSREAPVEIDLTTDDGNHDHVKQELLQPDFSGIPAWPCAESTLSSFQNSKNSHGSPTPSALPFTVTQPQCILCIDQYVYSSEKDRFTHAKRHAQRIGKPIPDIFAQCFPNSTYPASTNGPPPQKPPMNPTIPTTEVNKTKSKLLPKLPVENSQNAVMETNSTYSRETTETNKKRSSNRRPVKSQKLRDSDKAVGAAVPEKMPKTTSNNHSSSRSRSKPGPQSTTAASYNNAPTELPSKSALKPQSKSKPVASLLPDPEDIGKTKKELGNLCVNELRRLLNLVVQKNLTLSCTFTPQCRYSTNAIGRGGTVSKMCTFRMIRSLEIHIKSHLSTPVYFCRLCQKSFQSSTSHGAKIHSGLKRTEWFEDQTDKFQLEIWTITKKCFTPMDGTTKLVTSTVGGTKKPLTCSTAVEKAERPKLEEYLAGIRKCNQFFGKNGYSCHFPRCDYKIESGKTFVMSRVEKHLLCHLKKPGYECGICNHGFRSIQNHMSGTHPGGRDVGNYRDLRNKMETDLVDMLRKCFPQPLNTNHKKE